jgi:hypothetical protein
VSWPEHLDTFPARHQTGFKRDLSLPVPRSNPIGSGERWNARTTLRLIEAEARSIAAIVGSWRLSRGTKPGSCARQQAEFRVP